MILLKEDPVSRYNVVCENDTRDVIESNANECNIRDKNNFKLMLENDKNCCNISKLGANEIWENEYVKRFLTELINDRKNIVNKNNIEIAYINISNCANAGYIDENIVFEKNKFELLKESHSSLQLTIGMLFVLLSYVGYKTEKRDKSVSGIHDVSHAIYATECDFLLTMDNKFAKKCEAVYSFLGVKTKVVLCKQNVDYKRIISGNLIKVYIEGVYMWKKMMRSMPSLTYKKKFRCPKCKEYTLLVLHDSACECENDCDLDTFYENKVSEIISQNDFSEFYTSNEIIENFIEMNDDEINSLFSKPTDDDLLKGLSKKQKEFIETYFKKTANIEEIKQN